MGTLMIMIMMNDDDNHQMFDHLPKSMLRLEPTTTRRTKHCLILDNDHDEGVTMVIMIMIMMMTRWRGMMIMVA